MPASLENLRIVLTITLSILLLVVLFRRFRNKVVSEELPIAGHAELRGLQVAYHPQRLLVQVRLHAPRRIAFCLLDEAHRPLRDWDARDLPAGDGALELALDGEAEGTYHLQRSTGTQRIIRRFRLSQA